MILYVNGDSHAAGAEINNTYCFAKDDPLYPNIEMPHPENIPNSFGSVLSKKLNCNLFLDAISGSSNERILRKTKKFLENQSNNDIFLLIGWSSFEREEHCINGVYYQFSPGFNFAEHPLEVQLKYKKYIQSFDKSKHIQKTKDWHQTIWDFHTELKETNIRHLFFNSYMEFLIPAHERLDWENSYIGAYNHDETYWRWLQSQNFNPVNGGYHYGADAHAAWADRLYKWLTDYQLL